MKTQAIIPIAGTGVRLKTDLPKSLVEFCGKPLCVHALEIFEKCPVVDSVVLVGHKEKLSEFENIVKQHDLKKVSKVVAGGAKRHNSVACGLAVLDADTDIVVVHDGARPLVSQQTIEGVVALCKQWDAAITAVEVKPTIKKVDKETLIVKETLNRQELWEIQTPQAFKRDVLVKAHQQNKDENPTDDAVMVEKLGIKVKIFPGTYKNIKITTQEDLVIAKAFLQSVESSKAV